MLFLATMTRVLRIFLLILLLPTVVLSQSGQPFVTDIPFERGLGDVRVTGVIQTPDRSMLLCTSRGILSFDGAVWELIPTPSPPLTVAKAPDGTIYLGMRKGAARLAQSDSGSFQLQPIMAADLLEPVHQILISDEAVHLISDGRMVTIEAGQTDGGTSLQFGERIFSGAFLQFGIPHLLFYQEGLFSYQNSKLTRIGNFSRLAEHQLTFHLNTGKGTWLCFENGELMQFDGIRVTKVDGSVTDFLRGGQPSDAVVLNDTLLAISTLQGGAAVVDMRTSNVLHRLNLTTGLPDNEVTALGRDDNGGLWLAYASGISRLDLLHPIHRFHNYPGLKGMVTGTAVKGSDLYVGTGNGVFVLRESRDKAELKRVMAERAEAQNTPATVDPVNEDPRPIQKALESAQKQDSDPKAALAAKFESDPNTVKKELSRKELRELRKYIKDNKKKGGKVEGEEDESVVENIAAPALEPEVKQPESQDIPKAEAKPTSSAKSIGKSPASRTDEAASDGNFLFRPVKGLDVKCRQLTVVNNQLFAATGSGVFLIENEGSTNLTPGLYVNSISATKNGQTLLLAARSGAYLLSREGAKWQVRPIHADFKNNVYNLIEDSKGNIWGGSDNAVVRFSPNAGGFTPKEFALESGQLEHVLVTDIKGEVHLLIPSGIMKMEGERPVKADLPGLQNRSRLDFFITDRGPVYIHADGEWSVLNGNGDQHLLTYLPIFEDVRHITLTHDGRLIVVDEGKEVYSIVHRPASGAQVPFSVFIRKALAEDRTPFSMGALTVKPGENSVTFQLSAPFYLKSMATEYQYRVEGLRDSWSRWSSSSAIEIPFLPAGDYVLHVRARNVLGEVSEERTLPFTVLKPLWQRWYAILAYVLAAVGVILLIIKARERSLKETQRELEDKVQERTADLAREKELTERLLLNILPKETADELQKRGKATARHYNQVSVLFTDFKGFTRFAESTRPEDLVQELDRCFIAFDDIIEKYSLEKIKTIGDAYMCAGGVPIRNTNNAVAIVLAALEIRDFMVKLQQEKQQRNERFWEIRLGINTGPLTAGVVGKKKFAYDIWGDTVNTASRMESCSEPGKVNISASTYELVKDYFDCTYRGKFDAKGKGEVDMYFVNGIRKDFSENGDGVSPNTALLQVVA
jgi:class 3 adenylate cyclase